MILLGGSARADIVLGDFTLGTSPVQGWGVASLATATPPVAGTGSWLQAGVYQYWGQLPVPGWATGGQLSVANLNSYSLLEFDLILPSASWLGNGLNIGLEIQAENMATTSIPWTWMDVSTLKDQILHVSLDYSPIGTVPDSGWIDIRLNLQPGYDWIWDGNNPSVVPYTPQTLFLDNLTLTAVPEPSTFALAGMGLAGLLIFRRRSGR
jgi:hypothetical protein